jgi:two-component system nitrate/nitrite response regulator NarL
VTPPAPTRVLLVDDQTLFRGALAAVLDAQPDFTVVGQAADGRAGVDLALELRPDLVLMDVEMPGMDGVAAASVLLERLPGVKVVMLTVTDDDEHLLGAIRSGVHGYLLKDMGPEELFDLLRKVRHQETPVSPALVGRLLDALRTPPAPPTVPAHAAEALSQRELQILRLVAEGLTNREIGQRLFITEGTAKNHVHNALRKLQLENRGQAAAYIVREGLATS